MPRTLAPAVVALSLAALTACPAIEYGMNPQWEPSALDRLGCETEENDAALPEERPVAICETTVPSLSPIHESTDFLGMTSYDPAGNEIIDYQWRVVSRPDGSQAGLGDQAYEPNVYGFTPDLVGAYTLELTVTNDQCVMSEPCRVTVEAIPDQDLWVELSWEHPGDDMDLHLLNNGGSATSNADCYYGNCVGEWNSVDWGDPSAEDDDPHLDLDDIPGTGPENINIMNPAAGVYTVAVHDFPGTVYNGDNRVTVRMFLGGEKVYENTKTIRGEDNFVRFVQVSWPEGQVQSL